MHFNLEFWIIIAHIVHWCRELVEETGEIKRILKSWADGWRWHENLAKYKRLQGKYVLPRPSVSPLAEAKKLKYLEFLSQLPKPFQTFSHPNSFQTFSHSLFHILIFLFLLGDKQSFKLGGYEKRIVSAFMACSLHSNVV